MGKAKKPTVWFSEHLRKEIRNWPEPLRLSVGRQLNKVEYGGQPDDFKPMPSIGLGVYEIRLSDEGDQYRLIYVAKFQEAIYVLHVITKKKSQKTLQLDILVSRKRYKILLDSRRNNNQ